jgi:hypothetical protein
LAEEADIRVVPVRLLPTVNAGSMRPEPTLLAHIGHGVVEFVDALLPGLDLGFVFGGVSSVSMIIAAIESSSHISDVPRRGMCCGRDSRSLSSLENKEHLCFALTTD